MPTAIESSFARFFPDKNIQPFAYLLMQRLQEGHICMKVDAQEVKTPFGIASLDGINKVSTSMLSDNNTPAPFVFVNNFLYLHRYYHYETQIIECLQERMASAKNNEAVYKARLDDQKDFILQALGAINPITTLSPDEKIDWQLIGVLRALMNDFSIITGGPGTGKTTTLVKLLRLLFTIEPSSKVAIAAPTGKASMRMVDSLLQRAKLDKFPQPIVQKMEALKPHTLHRLLGYIHNSIYFKHNSENPLPYDWVVIDEASMIDLPMFAKLLSACGSNTRIVLLGDKDQLASVEAGSLLSDLCTSAGTLNRFSQTHNHWLNSFIADGVRKIPEDYASISTHPLAACITELRHSRRFEEKGAIGQLSLSIIRGEATKAADLLINNNAQISRIDHKEEDFFKDFVTGYIDFLEEQDIKKAMEKLNSIRVLATVREGKYGLNALNRKIETILHDIRPDLIKPTASFYHNRPVIITKNNYDLDLYNGDVGIVRMNETTKKLQVFFEPNKANETDFRPFSPASLSDCETVFAMTIHKSQGSEFDRVMVVLPEQTDNRLLTRELIYTGVTRAKNKAIICGSMDCLQAGITRQVVRISGIHQRIAQ